MTLLQSKKMLRSYADAHEIKYASKYGKTTTPPPGRKHMPRVFADMYIKIGRYKPMTFELGWDHYGIGCVGVRYIYDAD